MSAENQNAGAQSTASGAGKPGADHAAAPSGSRAGRGTATGHVAPSGQLSESQHITRSYVRVVKVFRRHDTRHTTGTRHLRVTGNLKATQKLLGHSRIETTTRYAHVLVDDVRDGLEAMDRAYAERGTKPELTVGDFVGGLRGERGR
jgi:hypothetical protein